MSLRVVGVPARCPRRSVFSLRSAADGIAARKYMQTRQQLHTFLDRGGSDGRVIAIRRLFFLSTVLARRVERRL